MKPDDFEKRLQSQPLRQIPTEWRNEILQTATSSRETSPAARRSLLSTIISQLSTPLWFNPKPWAGLAAMWVVIFALQSTSPKHSGMVATVATRQPSAFLMSLKDEQQTLVELMGNNQPDDMDQPRHASPKPRSELRNRFRVV
jgi:hypothetical protein